MADLATSLGELVQSITEMPGHFVDIAAHDPLSALLIAIGAVLVVLPVAAMGYLSLGAFVSLFTVDGGPQQPREAR